MSIESLAEELNLRPPKLLEHIRAAKLVENGGEWTSNSVQQFEISISDQLDNRRRL